LPYSLKPHYPGIAKLYILVCLVIYLFQHLCFYLFNNKQQMQRLNYLAKLLGFQGFYVTNIEIEMRVTQKRA
ncbi:hypothetical protein M1N42_04810, partial [Thermodesulfovibrionales bacterium]|nr:hypothetical protein [Thermodesulfovibrionales bacterium]